MVQPLNKPSLIERVSPPHHGKLLPIYHGHHQPLRLIHGMPFPLETLNRLTHKNASPEILTRVIHEIISSAYLKKVKQPHQTRMDVGL
jgi:hypothetical protein